MLKKKMTDMSKMYSIVVGVCTCDGLLLDKIICVLSVC